MSRLTDNELKIEFISKSNNEAFARISVAAFVSQLDPTIEELSDIKTVYKRKYEKIYNAFSKAGGIMTLISSSGFSLINSLRPSWKRYSTFILDF